MEDTVPAREATMAMYVSILGNSDETLLLLFSIAKASVLLEHLINEKEMPTSALQY